jgi:DNA-binding NtrC family response regulator
MSGSPKHTPPERPSGDSKGTLRSRDAHTILVVDDEDSSRESLRLILERHYRVLTAASGEKALEILEQEPVSVMTLDLRMPGWSGTETLVRLRDANEELEVVIITAYGSFSETMRALRLTAFDLVAKPFRAVLVLEAVRRAVARYERRRQGSADALQGLSARLLDEIHGLNLRELRRLSSNAPLDDLRRRARTLEQTLKKALASGREST